MQLPHPDVIRSVYQQVLRESLAFADARGGDLDGAAQVTQAFEARIPTELPADLIADVANPGLRRTLQRRAANELIDVCHGFTPPHPSRRYVERVAQKANDWRR